MRVKVSVYSGVVCEQVVYSISDKASSITTAPPRLRFENDEERAQHRENISRRYHTRLVNENFTPASLYSTLTFDDEHEVHTFQDAKRIRDLYVRRLQYRYPQAKLIIYMGRGKSTARIHFHMLSDGIPADVIADQWKCGTVLRVDHLRSHNWYGQIDYGADYTGLANYLYDHWTPERGGHRYKATRTLKRPRPETPKQVLRNYTISRPPKAPKGYVLVETASSKFGYLYYKYIKMPPKRGKSDAGGGEKSV